MHRLTQEQYRESPASGIEVVLDNIRSAHNVGSIFRSADAFKADKIWLCGICATPPSAEIHKSAIGAEFSVGWEYAKDTLAVIRKLHDEGFTVISAEQTTGSISIEDFIPDAGQRYALVFGNEVDGVQQSVVDASDSVIEIPQFGTKHSLNVSVTAGIVLWHIHHLRQ